jgi:CheY-like chemotaxis protein
MKESDPDRSTVPVTMGDPQRVPQTPPASPRVLLVEDNAVNQRAARVMLEKRGYAVDVAADGNEAVEATRATAYAAVLMDCQMPRRDGYAATEEIRRRDAQRTRVPIIAMTANADPGARERCLAAGMDDYVSKPVSGDSLDAVLRRWIPGAAAPVAPGSPVTTGSRVGAPSPAPPLAPSTPVIDLAMLRSLRASQSPGEPDIVAEVVALFLKEAPARLASLREAALGGDLAAASRAAHTLKGSAGHLGARTFSTLCARFEEKVRAGRPFDVAFAVDAIAEELDRVSAALAAERS